jgi:mRNA (guanine-N7-)-methyltransferase
MTVAEAYDRIAESGRTIQDREASQIIHLRHFSNWIKSCLIDRFCPAPNACVFDCSCGKGGDIPKWKLKKVRTYVFGDISFSSLKRAYEKFRKIDTNCTATFLGGDIFSCHLAEHIPPSLFFHVSSCQFALHYAFRDESLARNAISNLCERLLPGGHVLITIPNACRIVHRLRAAAPAEGFGNSVFEIRRDFELDNIPMFGAGYVFNILEAVDDCTEYLVHPAVLIALFQEFQCSLIETMEFHKYYSDSLVNFPQAKALFSLLLERSNRGEAHAAMTPDEWEAVSLYSYFVFRKEGIARGMDQADPGRRRKPPGKFVIKNVETGELVDVEIEPARGDG